MAAEKVPYIVAEYVRPDGSVGAVAVCDAGLASKHPGESRSGSSRRSSGITQSVSLGEPLLKDFVRLLKIGLRMFGAEGLPELTLNKVRLPHEKPSPQAMQLIESARARLDVRLDLGERGVGRVKLCFDTDGDDSTGFSSDP